MATTSSKPKLLVIVGPTASGKSDLAFKVAKKYNGEIIAADSRTVYKGMDIGTAKPTGQEQEEITHWGLDLVEPGQRFTVADFKKYAKAKIADIQTRDKLPILVGGTGLYIDAVLFNFDFRSDRSSLRRRFLSLQNVGKLQKIINKKGYTMPENNLNKRHLIRAIETKGRTGTRQTDPDSGVLIIGLLPNDAELRARINERAESYFKKGLLEETKSLLEKYGARKISKTGGIAYNASPKLFKKEITEVDATDIIQKEEWQYARRQKTWFKRNKFIRWFEDSRQAYKEIVRLLNT